MYSVPDIVLSLNFSEKVFNRDGILFCFRNDKEKIFNDTEICLLEKLAKDIGKKITKTDTVITENVFSTNRKQLLEEKLGEFKSSELVITDRLHGMIFSVITGTPCIAINNISKKIQGVKELWLKDIPYIEFCDSISQISQTMIYKMCSMGIQKYNQNIFDDYWKKIIESVKQAVEK